MAKISTKGRTPGVQQPDKYGGQVGPNYKQWGEQPGYVYIPTRDAYFENKKELEKQLQDQGAIDKPPGLFEQIAPVAGGAAALYAGKQIAENVFSKEGYEAAKKALGFGTPTATTQAVTPPASSVATAAPTGMFAGPSEIPLMPGGDPGGALMPGGPPRQPTGMFSPGSTGANVLGGASVALGGWQAYEGIKNKNPIQAGLGGAGVGMGLSQLGYAIPGWGWGLAIGVPLAASLLGGLGDKDMWKTEGNRLNSLKEKGLTTIPMPENLTRGRSKDELIAIEEEKVANGMYGNPEFAKTRDEKLLKPLDTWGAAANWELLGDDYITKSSEAQRQAFQESLINQGLWKEQHGSLYLKDKEKAKKTWDAIIGNAGKSNVQTPSGSPGQMALNDVKAVGPSSPNSTPQMNLRSRTISPGIDKEGNRISY